jgi:FKBP-type peptidyl-prolyl cis-trans isomerase FklB
MKSMVYAAGLMAAIIAAPSSATDLTTDTQKISYSVGYKVGKNLKAGQGDLKLDLDVLKQAITDVMTDAPLQMTKDEMKAAFRKLQEKRQAKAQMNK